MTYMPVGGHNVRKALSHGKLMLYPRAAILLADVWTQHKSYLPLRPPIQASESADRFTPWHGSYDVLHPVTVLWLERSASVQVVYHKWKALHKSNKNYRV